MQLSHVPSLSPRYWAVLCFASVLGANLGDLSSHLLHGHAGGLPVLAIFFAALMLAERAVQRQTEAFYWIAIVTLRTAATKAGDLITHDGGVAYPLAIAVIALVMCGALLFENRRSPAAQAGMPPTNAWFWFTMFAAGTLGTVLGDYLSDDLGLGTPVGSVLLGAVTAILLFIRSKPALATRGGYWLTVIGVRTAGTTLGDYLAFKHGLNLGLPVSSALMLCGMIGALLALPKAADRGFQSANLAPDQAG